MSTLADADLKKLLKICVDPANKLYELGWREFERRYQKLILGKIRTITKNQENIKDILQLVMFRLMANKFRALKNYRAKDSETAFRRWLSVISRMTALGFKPFPEVEIIDEREIVSPDKPKNQNGTHERVVKALRRILHQSQRNDYNIERDIFIFALRKIRGIPSKEVAQIPLLKIKADHVDTVVGRLMKDLKANKNDLGDLFDYLRDF